MSILKHLSVAVNKSASANILGSSGYSALQTLADLIDIKSTAYCTLKKPGVINLIGGQRECTYLQGVSLKFNRDENTLNIVGGSNL